MNNSNQNPFTTIKANDLDDNQINDQWVDLENKKFIEFLEPKNNITQYIIGGKGTGKTHLMRYFSYRSQLIRNKKSPLIGMKKDGYFGIYFQASALNGSRFEQLPYSAELKESLFEYSMELWCAGLVIQSLLELKSSNDNLFSSEKEFCKTILQLFTTDSLGSDANTIEELKEIVATLSNELDHEVNNSFINELLGTPPNFKIKVTRGKLIFGIPKAISKYSNAFEGITFIYLIDEVENISEPQQMYLNTLVREKSKPVNFRIGARRHGIKTWGITGSTEVNREGHEFEMLRLDDVFITSKNYYEFATNLVINRLLESNINKINLTSEKIKTLSYKEKRKIIDNFFEEENINNLIQGIKLKEDGCSITMSKFISKIRKKVDDNTSNHISKNIQFEPDFRIEQAAIHCFSQKWARLKNPTPHDLLRLSLEVKEMISAYTIKNEKNGIYTKLKYYQNNYVAIVLRAAYLNNYDQYTGFENLLKITMGFPRHILTVLRNIYKLEVFNGSIPFSDGHKISTKSQKLSLKESSDWFYEDCVTEGILGDSVAIALQRLCELLRIDMYSDKPVECSSSSFTVDKTKLTNECKAVLEWAEKIRVLIGGVPRQDKNSEKVLDKFYINGLLCPRWGLSTSRRGSLTLNEKYANIIFSPHGETESHFNLLKIEFEKSRNAPFELNTDETVDDKQLGLDL